MQPTATAATPDLDIDLLVAAHARADVRTVARARREGASVIRIRIVRERIERAAAALGVTLGAPSTNATKTRSRSAA